MVLGYVGRDMTLQVGGPVGPFPDRVQQRDVPVDVVATCEFTTNGPMGDPMQLENHVRTQLLRAMREVIGHKMSTGELSFRHLGTGDTAMVVPDIIGQSGLAQNGIMVSQLVMSFGIDGHPAQPPQGGQGMQQPQQPQHNLGAGTFDMGGGAQLQVQIDGKSPENFVKDKASQMIWGWVIGAIIVVVMLLVLGGVGIYVWMQMRAGTTSTTAGTKTWDGKSTFECSGNDVVSLTGMKATAGVKASGNCQLSMVGVSITAPVGIEASASAKVTMTGGSITASQNSVVASAAAHVDLVGTTVTGKSKVSGAAKVTGAP
jgi:hypothetical protein